MYEQPRTAVDRATTVEHLKVLEAYIAKIRSVVQQLASSCEALESRAKLQRYRLAPVRKLPLDIVRLVFVALVDTNDVATGNMPALTLSHVNRLWRGLANSLPSLWSTISITHIDHGDEDASEDDDEVDPMPQWVADTVTNRLRHCLSLSGTHLIDLTFREQEKCPDPLVTEYFR